MNDACIFFNCKSLIFKISSNNNQLIMFKLTLIVVCLVILSILDDVQCRPGKFFSDKAPNVEYRGPSLHKKSVDTTVATTEPTTLPQTTVTEKHGGVVGGLARGVGDVLSIG